MMVLPAPGLDPDPARRRLLGGGAAVAAAFTGPLAALATRVAEAAHVPFATACVAGDASALLASPYGATAPVNDLTTGLPLIELPAGFTYKSHGWRGDTMSDGLATPAAHDGMGIVRVRRLGRSTEIVLVRNHELTTSANPAHILGAGIAGVAKYDTGSTGGSYQTGGTTNLVWRDGYWVGSYASYGGIFSPCAGGASTWGSWLANEEVLSNGTSSTGRRHGYVFEVPADPATTPASTLPISAMGRMAHEACAIDPATGDWYLSEDQPDATTLYRFRPADAQGGLGSLHAGGQLQGLRVVGMPNADLRYPTLCQEFACDWVDIADPDLDAATIPIAGVGSAVAASGPYRQAYAGGAALFGGNEGCWVAAGIVYFTDKRVVSSPARAGRIWALHLASMTLKAIFVSNSLQVGNSPDNLCVSPRGGILFCEDGGTAGPGNSPSITAQHLKVLHPNGGSSVFARHNYDFTRAQLDAAGKPLAPSGNRRNTEWAGPVFSPDGRVLFVNLYSPGITLAITGPWQRGPL